MGEYLEWLQAEPCTHADPRAEKREALGRDFPTGGPAEFTFQAICGCGETGHSKSAGPWPVVPGASLPRTVSSRIERPLAGHQAALP